MSVKYNQKRVRRSVFTVGINDADYMVNPRIEGKAVLCPFYKTWSGMLRRCYYEDSQKRNPTYQGCSVVKE